MERNSRTYLGAEGVVIIVSILMAFGIQAWWEESQEDEEATRILASVLAEHRRNVQEIEAWEKIAARVDEAIVDIARTANQDSDISSEHFDEMLSRFLFYLRPRVQFGSIESLVSGGRLALIDDLSLREHLARWYGFKAYYDQLVETEVEYLDKHLVPFLVKNTSLQQIIKKQNQADYEIGVLGALPIGEEVDHRPLSQNPELLGHLSWKYLYIQDFRGANRLFMQGQKDFEKRLIEALGITPDTPLPSDDLLN